MEQRKSSRITAGNLPSRYRDDLPANPPPPPPRPKNQGRSSLMELPLPASSPQGATSRARPRGRPRGRPSTRQKPEPSEEPVKKEHNDAEVRIHHIEAAFPSLEPEIAGDDNDMNTRGSDNMAQSTNRDAMDAIMRSSLPEKFQSRRRNLFTGAHEYPYFFNEGRWIDKKGNTLHFLAQYYDERVTQYEAEAKDNQGDSKDRNAAFRLFLESTRGEEALQFGGKGAIAIEFEMWCASGAATSILSKLNIKDEDQQRGKTFKDKKFATLHFKLQWCIILEIENDLAHYPPRNAIAPDSGPKSYRYARRILGIGKLSAVHEVERAVQATKDQLESLPKKRDYARAVKYLKDKKLPVTLIELYNYLE